METEEKNPKNQTRKQENSGLLSSGLATTSGNSYKKLYPSNENGHYSSNNKDFSSSTNSTTDNIITKNLISSANKGEVDGDRVDIE